MTNKKVDDKAFITAVNKAFRCIEQDDIEGAKKLVALINQDAVEVTKKPAEEETRRDRLQATLNALNTLPYVRPLNLINHINGQLSVSERTKNIKMPIVFEWRDLMTDPNLALLNSVDSAKCRKFIMLVSVDLEGAKNAG